MKASDSPAVRYKVLQSSGTSGNGGQLRLKWVVRSAPPGRGGALFTGLVCARPLARSLAPSFVFACARARSSPVAPSCSVLSQMEAASDQPASSGPEEGPLVAVHFQKNPELVRKYLEAEPKALGISEILFSTFVISTSIISLRYNFDEHEQNITHIISSLFIVIAGAVAIAAKNLHLPTVKACLGLQVLACLASVVNFMVTFSKFASPPTSYFCWMSHYGGGPENVFCSKLISTFDHYNAAAFVVHVTLIAISGTLAAYCCKVIDCCCPKSKMPVITVNAPPAEQ